MQVRSNRVGDIRDHYKRQLLDLYVEREADIFLFILFEKYCGLSKGRIFINQEETISESQLLKFHFAVKDLLNYKPIQYITEETEFYGLPFFVNPDVLIPRPETEELVEWTIKENKGNKSISIIDIGTGSGCISIALKKHMAESDVDAVDISERSLALAKKNAQLNKVKIGFSQLNILDKKSQDIKKEYDIIVSNPPYVRHSEKKEIRKNVLDYEPDSALFVEDEDPLIFYKAIIHFAKYSLKTNGSIYCEINQYLANETEKLFLDSGYITIVRKDLKENSRMIKAYKD